MQSNHKKAERAKLFLPFEALSGFQSYLRLQERVVVKRRILSEDESELLNQRLLQVYKGCMIRVVYYDRGQYLSLEGIVARVELEYLKQIQVVQTVVACKDIVELEIL